MFQKSPIAHVDSVKAPVLILIGSSDRRVPPINGVAYFNALRERGVKTRYGEGGEERGRDGRVGRKWRNEKREGGKEKREGGKEKASTGKFPMPYVDKVKASVLILIGRSDRHVLPINGIPCITVTRGMDDVWGKEKRDRMRGKISDKREGVLLNIFNFF
jgi:hypothetical protein